MLAEINPAASAISCPFNTLCPTSTTGFAGAPICCATGITTSPFAASDPLHVLPACIIGSGLAGALSMVFNCTLMAPHGGIFVFPVVGNGLMYFVALVAGTIVSAVLLGALKKKVA